MNLSSLVPQSTVQPQLLFSNVPFQFGTIPLSVYNINVQSSQETYKHRDVKGKRLLYRYLKVFDDNFDLAINFYLLQKGIRPSFLIEFANFSEFNEIHLAKRGVEFAKKEFSNFYQGFEQTGTQPRYLISNPKMVDLAFFNQAMTGNDDVALGKVLGYHCPGGLENPVVGIDYGVIFNGEQENVTGEFCDRILSDIELKNIINLWKTAEFDGLKIDITMEVLHRLDENKMIVILTKNDINDIYKHRKAIAHKFGDFPSTEFIEQAFMQERPLSEFKKWWDKYHVAVRMLTIFLINDPCSETDPLSQGQFDKMDEIMENMIHDIYHVFTVPDKPIINLRKTSEFDGLKIDITTKVLHRVDEDKMIDILTKNDINDIYKHRKAIAHKFGDFPSTRFIEQAFMQERSLSEFKKWWDKYHVAVRMLTIFLINNPCSATYPLSQGQFDKMDEIVGNMINDIYHAFTVPDKPFFLF